MDVNLGLNQDLINAVAAITEASCSAKKMEKEELHPNQKVLDKNKNGKLDADDFKKLRKEEAVDEEVEELDELSKSTLGSYVKKAASSLSKASHDLGDKRAQSAEVDRFTNRHMPDKFNAQDKMKDHLGVGHNSQSKDVSTIVKRTKGITSATNKLTKEQVEEIEALAAKHGLGE